jgi:hypothetical protein
LGSVDIVLDATASLALNAALLEDVLSEWRASSSR